VNDWFENLYEIRPMKVYQRGNKVKIAGRNWYRELAVPR
jgi:hypothetical protein